MPKKKDWYPIPTFMAADLTYSLHGRILTNSGRSSDINLMLFMATWVLDYICEGSVQVSSLSSQITIIPQSFLLVQNQILSLLIPNFFLLNNPNMRFSILAFVAFASALPQHRHGKLSYTGSNKHHD
jgi:hypothetical protein